MSQTSKEITGYLVENFSGMAEGKQFAQEAVDTKLKELDEKLLDGSYDPNDLNYNEVIENCMPAPLYQAFEKDRPGKGNAERRALIEAATPAIAATHFDAVWDRLITRHMKHFRRGGMSYDRAQSILAEEAVAPIVASQVDRYRERCTNRVVADFSCGPAGFTLKNQYSRINMPCSDYQDNKVCEFPLDAPPDICCGDDNDDDPAKFYGLGEQRCWKLPHPCFMSFAFGMHRNLVCLNANEWVRQQIEARVAWFDIIDEKNAVRLMFNAGCTGGCGERPYNYDGTTYTTGWKTAVEAAPWVNVVTDADLQWTLCSEGPMCALEQMFEDQRDPYNCFPVDCGQGFEVVLTRDCQKYPYMEVLGARSFEAAISGACCMGATSNRAPREGWSTTPIYSRWIWDILVDYYLTCYLYDGVATHTLENTTASAALQLRTAEYWATNTYLVSKSLSRTFGFLVDYDVSTRTLEGTNTWMYFDRGIRWARRYDRKATEAWLRPWLSILVRAFNPALDVDGGTLVHA